MGHAVAHAASVARRPVLVRSSRRAAGTLVQGVLFVGALLLVWHVGVILSGFPSFILPPPVLVIQTLVREHQQFLRNGTTTLLEILIGFSAALVFGFPMAALIASSRRAEKTIYPLLVGLRTVPTVALVPLFVLLFGFELTPKLLVVLLIAFFPIVVSSAVGLKSVPVEMILLIRSTGAGRIGTFRTISLPYALPYVFSGLKLGISLSVVGAIVGEFIGSSSGLGYLIVFSLSQQNAAMVFASLIVIVGMSMSLFAVVDLLERVAIPWHVSRRGEV
jgi:NitT/TauT family transport system permease protein